MGLTRRKKVARFILPVVFLFILIFAIFYAINHKNGRGGMITLYGNVDIREVSLAFHATGRIEDMYVKEGDHVKAGQLLAALDISRYEAALRKAEAQVASQKEVLAAMLAGTRRQQIDEARANVRGEEANLRDAEVSYTRLKGLAGKNLVSRQSMDDAEARLKTARAALDASRQALNLAVEGPRREDIAAARATLKAYEAALELARREFVDAKLYAPSDGIVENRILEPGDMASPSSPVFTIALSDPVWVRAYVDEPDLGRIALGMPASVTTDSFPGKVYKGWLGFISPTAEFTPKPVETTELRTKLVYQVRVFVSNPEGELRLGMPATVRLASVKDNDGAGASKVAKK
ncbi:MAG: efflux RND transporter periplasmic adaptor subunit [Desulfobacteraceae bacterium]|nr:efflux RND transporter periplasmic adaptor subunit [Desulfobacteraceae bacterium]